MRPKKVKLEVEPVKVVDHVKTYVADLEIFLSFANDRGAAIFHDWWYSFGHDLYQKYAAKRTSDAD